MFSNTLLLLALLFCIYYGVLFQLFWLYIILLFSMQKMGGKISYSFPFLDLFSDSHCHSSIHLLLSILLSWLLLCTLSIYLYLYIAQWNSQMESSLFPRIIPVGGIWGKNFLRVRSIIPGEFCRWFQYRRALESSQILHPSNLIFLLSPTRCISTPPYIGTISRSKLVAKILVYILVV